MGDGLTSDSIIQELNEIGSWLREQGEYRKANMIDIATGFVNRSENIQNAVFVLKQKLKEDPDLFMGWQSNIAMALYDQMTEKMRFSPTGRKNIHKLCNEGAISFLTKLIDD